MLAEAEPPETPNPAPSREPHLLRPTRCGGASTACRRRYRTPPNS